MFVAKTKTPATALQYPMFVSRNRNAAMFAGPNIINQTFTQVFMPAID